MQFNRTSYCIVVILVCLTILPAPLLSQRMATMKKVILRGKIIEKKTRKGIGFASLYVNELEDGVVCDANGMFVLLPMLPGKYGLTVSCLNYASRKIEVELKNDTSLYIALEEQSLQLPEVEVMATFHPSKGSNATIGQAALEYIQPVSLSDIFVLLPGNVMENNTMHQFNLIGSRQVGTDKNSSLGMAFVSDGIPVTNDAMRTQLYGISENGENVFDHTVSRRGEMNAGIDLRSISTDHIESIEIVRGISSAKEGNLSSGAIHIQSKKGETPLKIRVKSDPLGKLFYAGKGFKISDKSGFIHIGLDALSSMPDVRERLEQFTRITGQINYTNKTDWLKKPLDLSVKISGTSSINNVKSDELVNENDEAYRSRYTRFMLAFKGNWLINIPWLESVEMLASADYTYDLLTRHKMVLSSTGPSSMPISLEEGEHEGVYLPVKYYSDYFVDNKPLYFFLQTNFISRFAVGKHLNNRLQYGFDFKSNKNVGKGAVVDATRPPYPGDNTFIRPRPNYVIPALMHGAMYVENRSSLNLGTRYNLSLQLGVRATQMVNLPNNYFLNGRLLVEPRLQAGLTIKHDAAGGKPILNTLRIGYGEENKLPTLDMLYPDKLYRDFAVLNAYYQDPDRNYLLVNTRIHTPLNEKLKENKNRKLEIGWDIGYAGFEMSISAFRELSQDGFSYFPRYYPVAFNRYLKQKHPVTGKPRKEDYHTEYYRDFTLFPVVENSAKTIKKGLEYRIKTPVVKPLNTTVEVNGAYYKTVYTKGIPVMYRPAVMEFDQKYPYVGIYQGDTHLYRSRFNTNIWINTHIPRFGLVFTNFIQSIWFSKMRNGNEEEVLPSHYLDYDGKIHAVDAAEIAVTQGPMRYLRRERSELYYRTETKPISLFWNIKASKELGRLAKLSFFVNKLIDINPYYKAADKTTEKEWAIPYFGAELIINIR